MRPSVVVLGFVLGSSAAISFALLGVAVVFAILRAEYPRLGTELPELLVNLAMFSVLTALAGASFYGQLRNAVWRRVAIGMLLLGLAFIAWVHWPR
jgi:Na+-transporting NADH:ubiquinone oxidoreductase subunit NqrB